MSQGPEMMKKEDVTNEERSRNKRSETEPGKGLPEAQEAEAAAVWQGNEQTHPGGSLHCRDGQAGTLGLAFTPAPIAACSACPRACPHPCPC